MKINKCANPPNSLFRLLQLGSVFGGVFSGVFGAMVILMSPMSARADYLQRFTLGAGIISIEHSSENYFELNGEYEYRLDPYVGVGGAANYIFSSPSITLLAVPDVFFHPFGWEFLISAAPLIEFGPGAETDLGARFGTRIPIPIGTVTIIPTFAIDFIKGERNFLFGLGLQL